MTVLREQFPVPLRIRSTDSEDNHVDASFILAVDPQAAEYVRYPAETFIRAGDIEITPTVSGGATGRTSDL